MLDLRARVGPKLPITFILQGRATVEPILPVTFILQARAMTTGLFRLAPSYQVRLTHSDSLHLNFCATVEQKLP